MKHKIDLAVYMSWKLRYLRRHKVKRIRILIFWLWKFICMPFIVLAIFWMLNFVMCFFSFPINSLYLLNKIVDLKLLQIAIIFFTIFSTYSSIQQHALSSCFCLFTASKLYLIYYLKFNHIMQLNKY